jgi:hypothetical protein
MELRLKGLLMVSDERLVGMGLFVTDVSEVPLRIEDRLSGIVIMQDVEAGLLLGLVFTKASSGASVLEAVAPVLEPKKEDLLLGLVFMAASSESLLEAVTSVLPPKKDNLLMGLECTTASSDLSCVVLEPNKEDLLMGLGLSTKAFLSVLEPNKETLLAGLGIFTTASSSDRPGKAMVDEALFFSPKKDDLLVGLGLFLKAASDISEEPFRIEDLLTGEVMQALGFFLPPKTEERLLGLGLFMTAVESASPELRIEDRRAGSTMASIEAWRFTDFSRHTLCTSISSLAAHCCAK